VEIKQIAAMPGGTNGAGSHSLNGGKLSVMGGGGGHPNQAATSAISKGCWTIGLVNSKFKYLSAEKFGYRTNANGKSLKKMQIWLLEPAEDGKSVTLKSHMEKFLAVDQFGNVTCDQEEKDENSRFEITVCDDNSGRWAFRSITRGYFLGANGDSLQCVAKSPGAQELWHVHLAARPQVNLFSLGRKRYAHLSVPDQDEIWVEENVPWGEDTLFTLEFREEANKYAIHTCTNQYLQKDGKLTSQVNKDCYFSCEYHGGYIALRDLEGQYLSPIGSRAVLKSRSKTANKEELFSLEDSLPQAAFVAASQNPPKYVSVKQGVDLTANQEEISEHESFQLEFDTEAKKWYMRTTQDKYFVLQPGGNGGIQASETKRCPNALFELLWHSDGSISFVAANGKFVGTKKSGHLFANCDVIEDNARFFFYLINRPILVLKCEQGFVGYKNVASGSSNVLECNKANYETLIVEREEQGKVHFKGQNGKYLRFGDGGLTADSETPTDFYLELRDPTHMCIKNGEGRYVMSEKNGTISLGSTDEQGATRWEY